MSVRVESDFQFSPEEMLEFFGWPKWSPKKGAIPKYREWWKSQVSYLPTKPHLPNAVLIAIDGSAQAGKSALKSNFEEQIHSHDLVRDWDVVIYDELTLSLPGGISAFKRPPLSPPFGQTQDTNDWFLSLEHKSDWATSFFMQIDKQMWWNSFTQNIAMNPPTKKTLIIGYRGPVDIMIWQYAIAAHQGDPNFEIPNEARFLLSDWGFHMAYSQTILSRIDAVVQIGICQQEAQRRRRVAGKTQPGWVTDSPMYNDLHCWTNHWIQKVYPTVKDIHGTGLAIINGDNTPENLSKQLSSYIVQVLKKVGSK